MKKIRIRIEIEDTKTLKKAVGWVKIDAPTTKQIDDANSIYQELMKKVTSSDGSLGKIKTFVRKK